MAKQAFQIQRPFSEITISRILYLDTWLAKSLNGGKRARTSFSQRPHLSQTSNPFEDPISPRASAFSKTYSSRKGPSAGTSILPRSSSRGSTRSRYTSCKHSCKNIQAEVKNPVKKGSPWIAAPTKRPIETKKRIFGRRTKVLSMAKSSATITLPQIPGVLSTISRAATSSRASYTKNQNFMLWRRTRKGPGGYCGGRSSSRSF